MSEIPLDGGAVSQPVRLGDTVHRREGPHAEFVHDLLRYLEDKGWPGAPRLLGRDSVGREVLTYLNGYVPHTSTGPLVTEPDSLAHVARLLRQFHDLTAGTPLAGEHEVVCHNDLSPKNTVYESESPPARPVAFLDWDLAAPGSRIHDLAHVCWQYLNLGPDMTDIAATASRVRLICDTYGHSDRLAVIDTVLWWQQRCWRGIASAAAAGDPAMIRLRNAGTIDSIQKAHQWVRTHRSELAASANPRS